MMHAFGKKNLNVGDCLKTQSGEYYIYLGQYTGRPRSFYNVPSKGYLYMFYGRNIKDIDESSIMKQLSSRTTSEFDGNFSYTKNPKRFEEKVKTFALPKENFYHIMGLTMDDIPNNISDIVPENLKKISSFVKSLDKEFDSSTTMCVNSEFGNYPDYIQIQIGLNLIELEPSYENLVNGNILDDINIRGAYGQRIETESAFLRDDCKKLLPILTQIENIYSEWKDENDIGTSKTFESGLKQDICIDDKTL